MIAIYALGEDLQLIDYGLPYDNLQWTRRYYTFGEFSVRLPVSLYKSTWKYIGTEERPELGIIQKVVEQGDDYVMLSGYFFEYRLNDKACYPREVINTMRVENAMRQLFTHFKGDSPVTLGAQNDPVLGEEISLDVLDSELGWKLYEIAESAQISYRVRYDYKEGKLYFEVWQGKDRTQDQTENSLQTFSTEFGNLGDRQINIDNSGWKNYAIVPYDEDEDGKETGVLYIDETYGEERRDIVIDLRSSHPEDRQTYAEFKESVRQEALERLHEYKKVENVDVQPLTDLGYMTDWDLGDLCDVYISTLDLTTQARIVEVYEVFKPEGHEITVGLGNKRIIRARSIKL